MWIIKRLFGREKSAERIVGLDDAETWIKERKKTVLLMPEAKPALDELRPALDELGASIKDLSNAGVPEDASERLKQLGISNRDNMLAHLGALHGGISVPAVCDFESVSKFYSSSVEMLKQRTELSLRSHYYVKALFGPEANRVILDIKRLEGLLLGLKEPVEKKRKVFDAIEGCEKEISHLRDKLAALEEIKNNISSASGRAAELRQEKEELEKKSALLRKDPEWARLDSLKRERVEVEKALEAIDRECADFCAPVSAAVEKMLKLSASGRLTLSDRERDLASRAFLDLPAEDAKELKDWLSKASSDGSLQLKDKAMERLRQRIPLFAGSLERYRKEKARLYGRMDSVEDSLNISEVNKHAQAIVWKMERIDHELEDLRVDRLGKKRDSLESEVSAGERGLADLLKGLAEGELEFSLMGAPP